MIQQNYQESVIKKSVWGNLDSEQFKVYVKLHEKDIDSEFLRHAGVDLGESKKEDALKPRPCGQCHYVNPSIYDYCGKCGLPLTDEAAANLQGVIKAVDDDPRFKEYQEKVKRLDEMEERITRLTMQLEAMTKTKKY